MKSFLISFFFIGIILFIIGYYMNKEKEKDNKKIIYKFLDQTIEEAQQGDRISLVTKFKPMFEDASILT